MNDCDSDGESDANARNKTFIRLFTAHYSRLFAFVLALQPNLDDADDLMQEVSIRLWEKFDDFTPESNFLAWSRKFARYVVMNHRSSSSRSKLLLDDKLLAQIAYTYDAADEWLELRRDALSECVANLKPSQQNLLNRCLHREGKVADVASAVGCSVTAIYKRLNRIRTALESCVKQRLNVTNGRSGNGSHA